MILQAIMKNKWTASLYDIHSFLSRLYFYLPILILSFQGRGFTQFEISILLSCFFLSTTLSEVPTGIFSDRVGHKWAMALCGFCQALGVLFLGLSSQFLWVVVGEVLMGLGQAFYTGSKEAYLFNSLEVADAHTRYQKDYARAKLFEFIGMATAALIGGSIYAYSPRLPFFLATAAFLCAGLLAVSLREPPREVSEPLTTLKHLSQGLQEIYRGAPTLKLLVTYFCATFTVILIFTVVLGQPTLRSAGMPLPYFGLVYLFFYSCSMGGSLLARRLSREGPNRFQFAAMAIALSAALAGLAVTRHPLVLVALLIGVIYLAWGLFIPTTSGATNRLIHSRVRATVLSAQDLAQNLLFVIIAPLLGLAVDHGGLTAALWPLCALALVSALLSLRMRF